MSEPLKYAEILDQGRWRRVEFHEIRAQDIFRLFEPDGTPVDDGEISLALGPAYEKEGLLTVRQQPAGRRKPPETLGDGHTCPRRREMGLDDPNSPFAGAGTGLDDWRLCENGDRCCSYCGSWHPDEFLAHLRAGGKIEMSDKGYKIYVRRQDVANASGGAIKFYAQHIPGERGHEFEDAINEALRYG